MPAKVSAPKASVVQSVPLQVSLGDCSLFHLARVMDVQPHRTQNWLGISASPAVARALALNMSEPADVSLQDALGSCASPCFSFYYWNQGPRHGQPSLSLMAGGKGVINREGIFSLLQAVRSAVKFRYTDDDLTKLASKLRVG